MLPSVDGRLEAIAGPVLGVYTAYLAETASPGRCYIALGVISGTDRRNLIWSDATVSSVRYLQELRIGSTGAAIAANDSASISAGRVALLAGGSATGTVVAGWAVAAVSQQFRLGGLSDTMALWPGTWACAVYAAKPSDAQIKAVIRWLARRYGTAPPIG